MHRGSVSIMTTLRKGSILVHTRVHVSPVFVLLMNGPTVSRRLHNFSAKFYCKSRCQSIITQQGHSEKQQRKQICCTHECNFSPTRHKATRAGYDTRVDFAICGTRRTSLSVPTICGVQRDQDSCTKYEILLNVQAQKLQHVFHSGL